ncbi:hypothetical protein [Ktedonospora formicarum]|uniref:hypothetical protein n=1 Tax=Ktedonospora formicarum TaxID=2778364 RepID=UPI001C68B7BC|nr:hypothetical protein [Ktedonospora formicarum]
MQDELAQRGQKLRAEIQNTARSVIKANGDEGTYIADLVMRYTIALPQLDFENIQKSERYEEIHGSQLPGEATFPDHMYRVWIVTFSLKGNGDLNLLRYVPRGGAPLSYPQVKFQYDTFSFEVRSVTKDIEKMKQEKERTLSFLRERLAALLPDLEEHNRALQGNVTRLFEQQKELFSTDKDLLDQL